MSDNTTATLNGSYAFNNQADRESRLIARQWHELSRKHGDHGRPFTMTVVRDERGRVSVFGGYPAGKVDK